MAELLGVAPRGKAAGQEVVEGGGHAARSRCCDWRHPWTRWSRAERGPIDGHETETAVRPARPVDGYLPITDHGLIADGTTAGPVAGMVPWSGCAGRALFAPALLPPP